MGKPVHGSGPKDGASPRRVDEFGVHAVWAPRRQRRGLKSPEAEFGSPVKLVDRRELNGVTGPSPALRAKVPER